MKEDTPQMAALRLHVAEADRVFGRGWICVGHVAMLVNTGDYFTVDLVGNLMVAVRSQDHIRVLSRVCLHRWASLIEGAGNVRRFTCPFHAWSYALDGRLIAAAFMERADDFDRSQCRLPEIRTEIAAETGLIFVNLSDVSLTDEQEPPTMAATGLLDMMAKGPLADQIVEASWTQVIKDATAASPEILTILPNGLIRVEQKRATLQLLYPNGPEATLIRTVELIAKKTAAITDEATQDLNA